MSNSWRVSHASFACLQYAEMLARQIGESYVRQHHVLLAVLRLEDDDVDMELVRLQVDPREFFKETFNRLQEPFDETDEETLRGVYNTMEAAEALAGEGELLHPIHIFRGLIVAAAGNIKLLMKQFGLDHPNGRQQKALPEPPQSSPATDSTPGDAPSAPLPPKKTELLIMAKSLGPTLKEFGVDLTDRARNHQFDPLIGREKEIERALLVLCRRRKRNPLFIGEAGVGKTALAEGIAQRIASGNVPAKLRSKILVSIDLGAVVAGTTLRGQFEARILKIISEAKDHGDVLLFIDEMHTMLGAGSAEGSLDASNMLKGPLARGELQIVGATTVNEYRKTIERNGALARRFQVIQVPPPTVKETEAILIGLAPMYEQHHSVTVPEEVLRTLVELADRFIQTNANPDKSIDLLDEACAIVRRRAEALSPEHVELRAQHDDLVDQCKRARDAKETALLEELSAQLTDVIKRLQTLEEEQAARLADPATTTVTVDDVAAVLQAITGVEVGTLTETEETRLLHLEEQLHKRMIGQDEPVAAVASAIRRARVGLKDPNRPIGSFLFLGPTGVGKTELARVLAEILFGSPKNMKRFDMSEFSEKHTAARLIGAPPGYVGFDEGGQLTEAVRRTPYSVILLDEIEKAHPDVWNVLLQVLDDGRLTDGRGTVVDFTNTIIIMTSNVGARNISEKLGEASALDFESTGDYVKGFKQRHANILNDVMRDVRKIMRPELINRIDEILTFQELLPDQVRQIIDKLTANLLKVAAEKGIKLTITDAAKEYLMSHGGYDSAYGARPMRRAIQTHLENPLAEAILKNEFKEGDIIEPIEVRGKLRFKRLNRRRRTAA